MQYWGLKGYFFIWKLYLTGRPIFCFTKSDNLTNRYFVVVVHSKINRTPQVRRVLQRFLIWRDKKEVAWSGGLPHFKSNFTTLCTTHADLSSSAGWLICRKLTPQASTDGRNWSGDFIQTPFFFFFLIAHVILFPIAKPWISEILDPVTSNTFQRYQIYSSSGNRNR